MQRGPNCKCRNCGKIYQEGKSRADWKGFCSAKCQHLKARALGHRGKASEYDVLKRAGEVGSVFVDRAELSEAMTKPRPKIEIPSVEHWTDGTMVDNRCPECNAAFRPTTIDLGHEQTCPRCKQVCYIRLDDDMSLGRSVYWH